MENMMICIFYYYFEVKNDVGKLSYVVILVLVISIFNASRFQFHLSHSSVCYVPYLLGRDGTDDIQKVM